MDMEVLEKKLKFKIQEKIKDRILVETKANLHSLPEVKEVIKLKLNWTKFKDMKQFVEETSKCVKKDYNFTVKFLEKNKFSAGQIKKKLNAYLKKEGKKFDEKGEQVYVEFKGKKDLYFRVGIIQKKKENVLRTKLNYVVILENPSNVEEVSDFLRVCKVFNLPLLLWGKKRNMQSVLNSAKKITKGIDYDHFSVKIIESLPRTYPLIGFSKFGQKNEKDLVKKLNKVKLGLVFGNDKFGLSQKARGALDLYRLTPSNKKPLRACQALTYILGISVAKDL